MAKGSESGDPPDERSDERQPPWPRATEHHEGPMGSRFEHPPKSRRGAQHRNHLSARVRSSRADCAPLFRHPGALRARNSGAARTLTGRRSHNAA